MFFFLVMINLSAYYFFVRQLNENEFKKVFSEETMTKFGTICFIWIVFLTLTRPNSLVLHVILLFFPSFVLPIVSKVTKIWRFLLFKKRFLRFLNNTILKMRLGNSFKISILTSMKKESQQFQKILESIIRNMAFSTHSSIKSDYSLLQFIAEEFRKIEENPHTAIQRLESVRHFVREKEKIRRKSGQVLRQIYIQVGVITALYLALLIYVVLVEGFEEHIFVISLSVSLFLFGTTLMLVTGRKVQWRE